MNDLNNKVKRNSKRIRDINDLPDAVKVTADLEPIENEGDPYESDSTDSDTDRASSSSRPEEGVTRMNQTDKQLTQKAIWDEIYREDGTVSSVMKNCSICGKPFIPTSNRQKFCSDCKLYADRAKGQEKQRRYASSQKTKHESDRLDPSECP